MINLVEEHFRVLKKTHSGLSLCAKRKGALCLRVFQLAKHRINGTVESFPVYLDKLDTFHFLSCFPLKKGNNRNLSKR